MFPVEGHPAMRLDTGFVDLVSTSQPPFHVSLHPGSYFWLHGSVSEGTVSPFCDSRAPLPENEVVRVENHGADEAHKKKKHAEKLKKEVGERAKLQCGEHRQGSDEDLEYDGNNDNVDEEEEDDIPWDELARDDEGSSMLPSASAQVPPGLCLPRCSRGRIRARRR
jgi:hypothetical protein